MPDPEYSIFISHAAVDEEIARELKAYIVKALPAERVFVSSDPEDLALGDEWVPKILSALEKAKLVLLIATERGLARKWVWFEAGRTWFSGIKMLPCCIGEIQKGMLQAPFSGRMAANIDDPKDVDLLFKNLQQLFGPLSAIPDFTEIARKMSRLGGRAEERSRVNTDPFLADKLKEIDRQMKLLSPANRETIKQYLIYGELSTASAKLKVRDAGLNMDRWSVPQALATNTGWLVAKPGNAPAGNDYWEENSYLINPQFRPLLESYFLRKDDE